MFTFTALDELAQILRTAGVRSVERDPARVNLPGIWVRFDGIGPGTLSGVEIRTTLHLIVGDSAKRGTVEADLAELFNIVSPVLDQYGGASGDTLPAGVVLPGSQTPLPALAVPFTLIYEEE